MTAIRFTAANAESASIASGTRLDYNSSYTLAGWIYVSSDTGSNACFLSLQGASAGSSGDYDALMINPTSLVVRIECFNGFAGATLLGSTGLAVNAWHHVAFVRSGSTITLYLDDNQEDTDTMNPAGRDAISVMEVGATVWPDSFDGRMWGWNAWTAALSAGDISAEYASNSSSPVRTANLYATWPFDSSIATRSNDTSGNGHHWTEANTPTDEAGPFDSNAIARQKINASLVANSPLLGGLVK